MQGVLASILVLGLLNSCGNPKEFKLSVDLVGVPDGKGFITSMDARTKGSNPIMDTIVFVGGKAKYARELEGVENVRLVFTNAEGKRNSYEFIAAPGESGKLSADVNAYPYHDFKGLKLNEEYKAVWEKYAAQEGSLSKEKYRELIMSSAPDNEKREAYEKIMKVVGLETKYWKEYIAEQPQGIFFPIVLYSRMDEYSGSELLSIVESAGEEAKSNRYLLAVVKEAELKQKTDIGVVVPDVVLPGVDGKISLKLSDVYAKHSYTLIDFWASWCGPCRNENPHVVEAYNTFKDRGFTVFNISLDNNKAKWLAAIEKDGLIWEYHVSELKRFDTQSVVDYGVKGIPANFLVDAQGEVVAKNLRGHALGEKLSELLE